LPTDCLVDGGEEGIDVIAIPECDDLLNYWEQVSGACCPLYDACDMELYPEQLCDENGERVYVPVECNMVECAGCPDGFVDGILECSCCPIEGDECNEDLYGSLFCVDGNPLYPEHCLVPIILPDEPVCAVFCPSDLWTFAPEGFCGCCPLKGQECNEEIYGNEFCEDGVVALPEYCEE